MSMEEVAAQMDQATEVVHIILRSSQEKQKEVYDAQGDLEELRRTLERAQEIAIRLGNVGSWTSFSVFFLPHCETAQQGYAAALEGSEQAGAFYNGVQVIRSHLLDAVHAKPLFNGVEREIGKQIRKISDAPGFVVAARHYEQAAASAQELLDMDAAYRAEHGMPAGPEAAAD